MRKLFWVATVAAAAAGIYLVLGRRGRTAAADEAPPAFAGNELSSVFHRLDCRAFTPLPASPAFVTRAQAVAAGYRPCGICKP